MNLISRLAQTQQAKNEEEPEYLLLVEEASHARRESEMQVKVGKYATEGSGTNKKVAKRSADKNMLEIPGFKVPQAQPTKPVLKSEEDTNKETRGWKNSDLF